MASTMASTIATVITVTVTSPDQVCPIRSLVTKPSAGEKIEGSTKYQVINLLLAPVLQTLYMFNYRDLEQNCQKDC